MNKTRFVFITIMILAAITSRFIPHPPNFTPIAGIALFGGAYYSNKKLALIIPLLAMFLSDLFIGLHSLMFFVYLSFAIIVLLGFLLREKKSVAKIAFISIAGSVIFFIITNFAVWFLGNMYPKNILGLINCYIAAIPFFKNSLAGDLFYTVILFGTFEILRNYFFKLKEVKFEN